MKTIKDLIYFDLGKATSLISQIEEGLLQEFTEISESKSIKSGGIKGGLPYLGADIEKSSSDGLVLEQKKVLHHELLNNLEEWLFANGFALDLNELVIDDKETVNTEEFRESLQNVSYIRSEGWSIIDDFTRLKNIAENFESLIEFINKSGRQSLLDNEGYQKLEEQISDLEKQNKSKPRGKEKSLQEKRISELKRTLEDMVKNVTVVDVPEEWIISGISNWIDQFYPNQIHFNIKPFENNSIQIKANLKREYFIDTDIEHLLFTYGTVPNIKLTLFGLITSKPPKETGESKKDVSQKTENNDKQENEEYGSAFREVFTALSEMENLTGFNKYPNIKVYPIAVYRKIVGYFDDEEEAGEILD